jgi:hypothetical protein
LHKLSLDILVWFEPFTHVALEFLDSFMQLQEAIEATDAFWFGSTCVLLLHGIRMQRCVETDMSGRSFIFNCPLFLQVTVKFVL